MGAGKPVNFHTKHKFIVRIDGFERADFSQCSELSKELGIIEHREGGSLLATKIPGLMTIPNVTLSRGASKDLDFYLWFKDVSDTAANGEPGLSSESTPTFSRTVEIVQLDRDGRELAVYRLIDAWPCKVSAGDWDNDAEEVQIEQLDLCVHTWERVAPQG